MLFWSCLGSSRKLVCVFSVNFHAVLRCLGISRKFSEVSEVSEVLGSSRKASEVLGNACGMVCAHSNPSRIFRSFLGIVCVFVGISMN